LDREAYGKALKACARVAREEHRHAEGVLLEVETSLRQLSTSVERLAEASQEKGAALVDAQQTIRNLGDRLLAITGDRLASARKVLDQKGLRLERFTVTLFGRTMAGKSTIREALTGGDGGTIGKGGQRTTRDVIEYEWESLRLVDTPGIGAYEGGVDRDLALSILDESDLVLFLLSSDGIQEEVFKGMQALRERNKPVIFLLNVKLDLERPVLRKRFLRDPSVIFSETEIGGHFSRIQTLAKELLGMPRVTVVPIHAQAAFLAGRPDHAAESDALLAACGIGRLFQVLQDEVRLRGRVRRLQTLLDGTINDIQDIQGELQDQAAIVRRSALLLKSKFRELDAWLDSFIKGTNLRIETSVAEKLSQLRQGVSVFVDDNIESDTFGEQWNRKIKALALETWAESLQKEIQYAVLARLTEFNREAECEASFDAQFAAGSATHYDPFNAKRTFGWTSGVAGLVSGASFAAVALGIGSANVWNPVGWVALGVGLAASLFAWLSDSREEKLQRQKAKAADQLRKQVDGLERRLAATLKAWFYDSVTSRLAKGIRKDTRDLIDRMFRLAGLLRAEADKTGEILEALNRRLIVRVCEFHHLPGVGASIGRIARDPGNRMKFVWLGPGSAEFARQVGRALGEFVDAIPQGTQASMTASALRPAKVPEACVEVSEDRIRAKVPQGERGLAYGRGKINLSLASRLLGKPIDIE